MEAHNKIKELTEKIYREGLEKANSESEQIIAKAKADAEKILMEAEKEAASIMEQAKKNAREQSERLVSEMRLSGQQALVNLKKDVAGLIQAKVVDAPISEAFSDQNFIRNLIETLVRNWKSGEGDPQLTVLLPKDKLAETEKYFNAKAAELMKKGLSLKEYPGISKGFEIIPSNGEYKISMSDEAFQSFLREHFKPSTVEFLFGGKQG